MAFVARLKNAIQSFQLWNLERKAAEQVYDGAKQSRFILRPALGGAGERLVAAGSEGGAPTHSIVTTLFCTARIALFHFCFFRS